MGKAHFVSWACAAMLALGTACSDDSGNGTTDGAVPPEDSGESGLICGNAVCEAGETCTTCPADCPQCSGCPDGTCEGDEDCRTCAADCGPCEAQCGNGNCETGEDCSTCPEDCNDCTWICPDGVCDAGESCNTCATDCGECAAICGNGNCETGEDCNTCAVDCPDCVACPSGTCDTGEDCSTCAADCGVCAAQCGNGNCELGEDCDNCAADCTNCLWICPDGICESGEDCHTCAADCGACPPTCGNGNCESGEDCHSCAADCAPCPWICPSGNCDPGEDCTTCLADCGACHPVCGNTLCEAGEDCVTCPGDCGACPVGCPNGLCEMSEDCSTCPQDCGFCPVNCPNGTCDAGEGCSTCPDDCGQCPGPSSFHTVIIADFASWDAIFDLWSQGAGAMITSQNPPTQIPVNQWAKNIHHSWYATGEEMADVIHQAFSDATSAPARIMIDELKSATLTKVAACANRMRTLYPQWAGRWGAYVVNGANVAYPNLNPAIDALLSANAIIAPEMYARQSDYCASGSSTATRDAWLRDFFRGTSTKGRFHWLVQRRTWIGSASQLTVLFGVTDSYMDGTSPAVFLDRLFYIWVTSTGYRSYLLAANGGAGAWKWDAAAVSNTSRDLAFKESFQHYCVDGQTNSRLGQVSCP